MFGLDLSPTATKTVISIIVVAAALVVRSLILAVVHRRIDDAQVWFQVRKWTGYVTFVVAAVILSELWFGGLDSALTYIGIVSAGIAIALADVLKNLAGWAYIMTRRPFKVGDRVEIGDHRGDVVDVRVFRFTLLEIGNWVGAEQSTGRLVHVPNGLLFTDPVANYTESFPFVWDEIDVLVTFESDWEAAERMVLDVTRKHAPKSSEHDFAGAFRAASRGYFIKYTELEPTVYLSVADSGVKLTARYLVPVRARRSVQHNIWRELLSQMKDRPDIELAYPTIRTYFPDRLDIRQQSTDEGEQ